MPVDRHPSTAEGELRWSSLAATLGSPVQGRPGPAEVTGDLGARLSVLDQRYSFADLGATEGLTPLTEILADSPPSNGVGVDTYGGVRPPLTHRNQ